MTVGALLPDVGLHFGRTGTVCASDVCFLFCFCLHFVAVSGIAFRLSGEDNASHDNFLDVVSAEICHIEQF